MVAVKANYLVVRVEKELYILNRWRIGIKWAFFLWRRKSKCSLQLLVAAGCEDVLLLCLVRAFASKLISCFRIVMFSVAFGNQKL